MTPSDSREEKSSHIAFPVSIFFLALIVRLVFVHFFSSPPVNDLLWNDAVGWNLANGNGYTASQSEPFVPGIFRTPGYPFFLAAVYFLFGHSVTAVYVAQAVMDSFSAVLLYWMALRYVNARVAQLTGLLYSLYPYPAIFCGVLHQDILLVFVTVLFLFVLTRGMMHFASSWRWFLVGALVGFSALVRANFVLFPLVPFGTVLFSGTTKSQKARMLSLVTIGFIFIFLPWVARNYFVFDRFPIVATGGLGTGLMRVEEELRGEDPLLKRSHKPPKRDLKGFLDGIDSIVLEKERARKAISVLKRHWPQYCLVMLKHIPRLWLTKYSVWHGYLVRVSGIVISWVVLILGLAGMFLLRRQWLRLLPFYLTIVTVTLIHIPYIVEARYTLPARPAMLLFVAYTLASAFDAVRSKRLIESGSMSSPS